MRDRSTDKVQADCECNCQSDCIDMIKHKIVVFQSARRSMYDDLVIR